MDNSNGKTVLALLAGLATGAALGILLAPRSGKETRAALRSKGEGMKEDLDERIDEARKEWSRAKGKMADAASTTKDEVSELIHHMFNKGKQTATRVKDEVTSAANDVADKAKRTVEDQQRAARSN
ncbi:MAG: YtxH domain-containing protein [Flavobacteriales bacterium]|nr:YtxH domain-containing protein [Flavobacteriales bacterium]